LPKYKLVTITGVNRVREDLFPISKSPKPQYKLPPALSRP
jgi:hypothetical protein